jgi:hypothetical protein
MTCSKNTSGPIDENDNQNIPVEKEWTFLFYNDADFTPGYDPLDDFAEKVNSGDNVNYLVLHDSYGEPANVYYIDKDHQKVLLKKKHEINMGDMKILSNYIAYAKKYYPANRYILSFYDHGAAMWGCCVDESNDDDMLHLGEIKQALAQNNGVDLVLFSAPCRMGNFESIYNLRNYTDIYIASENQSGYVWWYGAMEDISNQINNNPNISNEDLAKSIIQFIVEHRNDFDVGSYLNTITMSAVKTDKLDLLCSEIDSLCSLYLLHNAKFIEKFASIKDNIVYFNQVMDIKSFVDEMIKVENNPVIIKQLLSIKNVFMSSIISEYHENGNWDIGGLTILGPQQGIQGLLRYYKSHEYGLDIVKDSRWDELLQKFPLSKGEYGYSSKTDIINLDGNGWINSVYKNSP